MNRKIIQITIGKTRLVVLCDDGTIWTYYPGITTTNQRTGEKTIVNESRWSRLKDIPQD